jgi:hypothetical protein
LRVRKVRRLLRDFPLSWCLVDNFCKEFLHRIPWESDEWFSRDTTTEKDKQTEGRNIHTRRKLITSYRTSGLMGEYTYFEVFYGHTSPKLSALTSWECLTFLLTVFSIWIYKVSLHDLKAINLHHNLYSSVQMPTTHNPALSWTPQFRGCWNLSIWRYNQHMHINI